MRMVHAAPLLIAVGAFAPVLRADDEVSLPLAPKAVAADRYVAPDGSLRTDGGLLLSSGKIKSVREKADVASGKGVLHMPGAVISPGLIDAYSFAGVLGSNVETAYSIDPGANVSAGLDLSHDDFAAALSAGITTALIAPAANNLVSGSTAVVRTGGDGSRILVEEGALALALDESMLERDRAPTSRTGAMAMLRRALSQAKEGDAHERLVKLAMGRADAIVVAGDAMDALSAAMLLSEFGSSPTLVHTGERPALAADVAGMVSAVILPPYSPSSSHLQLAEASRFSAAGVPVAFAANVPVRDGRAMRRSAAMAVRFGLGANEARSGLTSIPAAIAGVDDRVGSLRAGLDADFVVFSDDPLKLSAEVLAVYIRGVRVWSKDAHGTAASDFEWKVMP